MDFTTFNEGRRAAVHNYRERVESIVRTLVREKKGRGPLLLKELILTYRNVGNPSRQYGLWESDNDLAYLAPLDKLRQLER